MKYAFVREYQDQFPIGLMCHLLSVAKSSYYAWLRRGGLEVSKAKAERQKRVKVVFERYKSRYGSPRVWRSLLSEGLSISKRTVEQMMRELGLRAKQKRRYRSTTDSVHARPIAPNILDRQFEVREVNRVWLSDITYLPMSRGGFAYLYVVMDLASRRIVGWAVETHMESSLVVDSFVNAVRSNDFSPENLIFHSDRGSQYASC